MHHFMVPVDGSVESWRVFDVVVELARRRQGTIEVVRVVFDPDDVQDAEMGLEAGLHDRVIGDVDISSAVQLFCGSVAETICLMVASRPQATVVIASRGQGRSAALLGSVAEDVVRLLDGPVVIVGPQAGVSDFSGPIIVTVDGSDISEAVIPIAAAWSLELGVDACVTRVVPSSGDAVGAADVREYVSSLAARFRTLSGRSAEVKVLVGRDVEAAVAESARAVGASLIVTSTRGRSGPARFVLGSTASGFVRRASCPVLAIRPKHTR